MNKLLSLLLTLTLALPVGAYNPGMRHHGHTNFGTGIDGAVEISADTQLPSVTDGPEVIKQYTTLTIDAGKDLTVSNRCKGLIIYVQGDCHINGYIDMDGKGAAATPVSEGTLVPMYSIMSGVRNRLLEITTAPQGGAGGVGGITGNSSNGSVGATADNGTGGGGGGAGGDAAEADLGNGGTGGAGTCYSGGAAASGGAYAAVISEPSGNNGSANGGPGGDGVGANTGYGSAGAPGNPGGADNGTGAGASGTGGILTLIVGGTLYMGNSAGLYAKGVDGTAATTGTGVGSAGTGGGRIIVICNGYSGLGDLIGYLNVPGGVGQKYRGGTGGGIYSGNGGIGSAIAIQTSTAIPIPSISAFNCVDVDPPPDPPTTIASVILTNSQRTIYCKYLGETEDHYAYSGAFFNNLPVASWSTLDLDVAGYINPDPTTSSFTSFYVEAIDANGIFYAGAMPLVGGTNVSGGDTGYQRMEFTPSNCIWYFPDASPTTPVRVSKMYFNAYGCDDLTSPPAFEETWVKNFAFNGTPYPILDTVLGCQQ